MGAHTDRQLSHLLQSSLLPTATFPFSSLYTSEGQIFTHSVQFVHLASSIVMMYMGSLDFSMGCEATTAQGNGGATASAPATKEKRDPGRHTQPVGLGSPASLHAPLAGPVGNSR